MKKPYVSFVIRTKNEGLWIKKVLELLDKQTFRNFEVLIVDSGSTDKTLEVINKFDVKLLKIKPGKFNYGFSLNFGIGKSEGNIIAIISGHSIPVSDDWLENGLKHFENEKVAAVSGYISMFPLGYFSRRYGKIFFAPYQRKVKYNTKNMTNTNSLIRKDLWERYHFNENITECEDYDWASEMIKRGYDVIKDPKFSVFHSHLLLGRFFDIKKPFRWRRICRMIDENKSR